MDPESPQPLKNQSESAQAGDAAPPLLCADDVRRVAKLARLRVEDEAVQTYRDKLTRVLGHIESLRALDLTGIEPMATPLDQTDRVVRDEPGEMLTNDDLGAIAPEMDGPFIRVPKVLSKERGEGPAGAGGSA